MLEAGEDTKTHEDTLRHTKGLCGAALNLPRGSAGLQLAA